MQCDPEPENNLAKAIARFATRRNRARKSFACPSFFARNISARRRITPISLWLKKYRATTTVVRQTRARNSSRDHRVAFRKTRRRRLSQHRCDHRRRRKTSRKLSQDAHPGRSAVSREVLLHARRSRLSQLENCAGKHRRLRLLGPMVPGSGAPDRFARRRDFVLSDRHWLAPGEKKQYGAAQHSAWETIQRSHAIANGCYVAVANRVGHERLRGTMGSNSGAKVSSRPSGEIIAKGSVDTEELVIADIDWKRVDEHRTHWPFLRDRRIDAYAEINRA